MLDREINSCESIQSILNTGLIDSWCSLRSSEIYTISVKSIYTHYQLFGDTNLTLELSLFSSLSLEDTG
jgi:hypothetical protein